jgi:hypothetical protein
MAEFDFGDTFKKAFGYNVPETDASKISIPTAPARKEKGQLGFDMYAIDLAGREFFLPVFLNDYLLPFAVIGMTWKKTIVETTMPERGGAVKELICIDDYSFNIKGILIDEDGSFPDSAIIELHNIFKVNKSITLRSTLTDIVLTGKSNDKGDDSDGHKVIVKQINWPAVAGVEHAKPFEMELKSDFIYDLEIE